MGVGMAPDGVPGASDPPREVRLAFHVLSNHEERALGLVTFEQCEHLLSKDPVRAIVERYRHAGPGRGAAPWNSEERIEPRNVNKGRANQQDEPNEGKCCEHSAPC